ncbi:glutathione S-transferase, partial [Pseudomonas gessardii]|nr:glutathione S-transferase [Pseudomonas gessardii]
GIPRHPATQSTNIRPPIPRSSGRAVGAQRRRFALLV